MPPKNRPPVLQKYAENGFASAVRLLEAASPEGRQEAFETFKALKKDLLRMQKAQKEGKDMVKEMVDLARKRDASRAEVKMKLQMNSGGGAFSMRATTGD